MANEFKIRKGLIVEGASGGVVVNVLGSQGQLLSVTDDLSGSIFAVSDISGVPIFDVNSSGVSYFDGNVGIGDTTPSFPLVISKSSSTSSMGADLSMRLGLINPDQTNNNLALITFGDGTSQPGSGFFGMQFTDHTNNYGELVFGTRGAVGYGERMRIDSEGKIQVGSDKVIWAGGYGGALVIRQNNATGDRLIKMVTVDSTGAIANDNVLVAKGSQVGIGGTPTNQFSINGFMEFGTVGSTDCFIQTYSRSTSTYGALKFITSGETMRITNTGDVGINTTLPDFKLDVDGTFGVSDLPGNGSSTSVLVQDQTTTPLAVVNGDFATDSDWSKGPGWTISGGKANVDGTQTATTYMNQSGILPNPPENIEYIIKYTISNYSAGAFQINVGGYISSSPAQAANGTYEVKVTPTNASSNTLVYIQANADAIGSIDTISVKQVTAGTNQIKTRQLSSDAFGPGNGPYLPLSAGSSFPLTGELHVDDRVIIENTTSLTTGVVDSLLIKTLSSGTSITNGFGGGLSFYLENTVYSAVNEVGKIAVIETDTIAIDDKMVFSVKDNNILAERLTLTGQEAVFTGNVGIGVTSPGNKLSVNGIVGIGSSDQTTLNQTSTHFFMDMTSSTSYFRNTSTAGGGFIFRNSNIGDFEFDNEFAGNIKFNTSNVERMRIDSSGSFGLGIVPKASGTAWVNAQFGQATNIVSRKGASANAIYSNNFYIDSASADKRIIAGESNRLFLDGATTRFQYAGTGAANSVVSWSESMRIDSSGNVGIGTTLPSNKLDVQITTSNRTTLEPVLSVSASGNGPYTGFGPKISFDSNIYYGASTGNPAGIIETAYIGAVMGTTYPTNSDLVFATRDGATSVTEKMRILGNGNVGIGTDSPGQKLEVVGNIEVQSTNKIGFRYSAADYNMYEYIGSTGSGGLNLVGGTSASAPSTEAIRITTQQGTKMSVLNNGNVGIGVTGPAQKLHVVGKTISSVDLTVGNNSSGAVRYSGQNGYYSFITRSNYNDWSLSLLGTDGDASTDPIGAQLMTVNYSGKVGIGEASPTAKLEVFNSGGTVFNVTGSQGQLFSVTDNLSGSIFAVADISGVPILDVNSNGKVGINTTSAADIFDVRSPSWATRIQSTVDGTYLRMSPNQIAAFNSAGAGSPLYFNASSTGNIVMATGGGAVCVGATTTPFNYGGSTLHVGGSRATLGLKSSGSLATIALSSNNVSDKDIHINHDGTTGALNFYQYSVTPTSARISMILAGNGYLGLGAGSATYPLDVHQASTSGVIIRAKGIGAMVLIESNTAGEAYLYQKPNITSDKEARFMMTAGTSYGWAWSDDGSGTPASRVKYMKLDQNPGTLTVKGDVIAYGTPSDISLKENIKPIDSALDKVMKLQGVTFDWKKTDSILELKEDIGFIAQDVQKVVPELIRENSNGLLSMRHQGVAPILLEAIKELKAEIDLLKSKPCNCNKCNCNV